METPVIQNRAARHNYHILDTYEVGVVLTGTEVKSIRAGKMILGEAFVQVQKDELFLVGAHVDEYAEGNRFNHDPRRPRKLLAHRPEIKKIKEALGEQGLSAVALQAYFKGSNLKLEIAMVKGKKAHDKRADKAKQEAEREIDRALRDFNR